jgi:hypothetical protein
MYFCTVHQKTLDMKKNKNFLTISILVGAIMFVIVTVMVRLLNGNASLQIPLTLLGATITIIATYFLLTCMTTREEINKQQVKTFEKKQEVYHDFMVKLQCIVHNSGMKVGINCGEGADSRESQMQCLMSQISNLQMLASPLTINALQDEMEKMMQGLNHFERTEKHHNIPFLLRNDTEHLKQMPAFLQTSDAQEEAPLPSAALSSLNSIAAILQKDLLRKRWLL